MAVGLQLARARKPDLILLDVRTPGTDGMTVSPHLAADAELSHGPVVMLCARGWDHEVEAGGQTGVRAYLGKPFSPWELLELMDEWAGTAAG